jgi:hypothetical protein
MPHTVGRWWDCRKAAAAAAEEEAAAAAARSQAGLELVGAGVGEWVGRGAVKGPGRAMEKALACYGGDVSRLADLCRARIVLGDARALLACAERVVGGGDPAVRVLRVRNLLAPAAPAAHSAGFRVRAPGPPMPSVCVCPRHPLCVFSYLDPAFLLTAPLSLPLFHSSSLPLSEPTSVLR